MQGGATEKRFGNTGSGRFVAIGSAPRREGGLCVLGRGRLILGAVNPGYTHFV